MAMGELDKDAVGEKGQEADSVVSVTAACSICLEEVTSGGDRSTARLQCGHEFHLDCIGSAFNAKGSMQCPNCRKVEKGNWLFANGSYLSPEYNIDDWTHDEDLYDLSYSGMPSRLHWYPFGGVARIPSMSLEGDSSHAVAFQNFFRHHANFTEHLPTSSPSNPCPYLSYLHPFQPSSSSHPHASLERNGDSPAFHSQWSHSPRPADAHTLHTVGPGSHYCCLVEYHPHSYSTSGVHSSVANVVSPSATFSTVLDSTDPVTRRSAIPLAVHNHRYGSRVGSSSSFVPSPLPHLRAEDGAEHYQHLDSQGVHGNHGTGAPQSRVWISGFGPNTSTHPEQTGLFLFAPPPFSDRNTSDAINSGRRNMHHLPSFPMLPLARESSWWPNLQNFACASDSDNRMPICPRNTPQGWFLPDQPESIPRRAMPPSQMNSMFSTM